MPKNWNFSELYTNGKLYVMVNCSLAESSRNYDFIFSAIPPRCERQCPSLANFPKILKRKILDRNSRLDDCSVFCSVTNFIQCPKRRIPSLIRLKRSEQHFDLIGYMFTSVALDGGVHVSFSIPQREVGLFSPLGRSNGGGGIVQGETETFDNLHDVAKNRIGKRVQLDFVDYVRTLDRPL